jgi:hypothetical protein
LKSAVIFENVSLFFEPDIIFGHEANLSHLEKLNVMFPAEMKILGTAVAGKNAREEIALFIIIATDFAALRHRFTPNALPIG